ncbi:MAG TPA: TraR/DksA C4-type zinc finger protein [Longimicrobiaceae bacterium]|nr:TraR/DksA C4-type zinc finger protein [Longimicrobiaceae bacterium]
MTAVQSPLPADRLEQIRAELLRTLGKLERSLKISGENGRARDLEQDTVGRLSRIDAIQNQGFMQNLEERERVQLRQVVDALRRMEEGSYGACTACGGAIPYERLIIFPETLACTACTRRA